MVLTVVSGGGDCKKVFIVFANQSNKTFTQQNKNAMTRRKQKNTLSMKTKRHNFNKKPHT